MFKTLGPNWVESSDGYSVRITGRLTLLYAEGDRQVDVEVEPGEGLAVYAGSIEGWNPPFEEDPLTASDRRRIVARIVDGLAHMGVKAVVD